MKKIGILFGMEASFPPAFVERVNQKTGGKDIVAEFVRMDKVIQGEPLIIMEDGQPIERNMRSELLTLDDIPTLVWRLFHRLALATESRWTLRCFRC